MFVGSSDGLSRFGLGGNCRLFCPSAWVGESSFGGVCGGKLRFSVLFPAGPDCVPDSGSLGGAELKKNLLIITLSLL